MENKYEFHIEQLPEGLFRITSPLLAELSAQGESISEAIDAAMEAVSVLQAKSPD